MRYYTFLFKMNMNEPWKVSERFVARNEDDAIDQAIKYAEKNGFCDFILI